MEWTVWIDPEGKLFGSCVGGNEWPLVQYDGLLGSSMDWPIDDLRWQKIRLTRDEQR